MQRPRLRPRRQKRARCFDALCHIHDPDSADRAIGLLPARDRRRLQPDGEREPQRVPFDAFAAADARSVYLDGIEER